MAKLQEMTRKKSNYKNNIARIAVISLLALQFGFISQSVSAKPTTQTQLKDWPKINSPIKSDVASEAKIKSILSTMTLRQKIGQMTQAEIRYITPKEVQEYYIGSVLNGGGAWPSMNKHASLNDWVALSDAFYDASMKTDMKNPIPIIWGIDAVHGNNNVYGATIYPHNIGLGAAHDAKLVGEIGAATARAVRATGIQWAFAPTLAVVQNQRWGRTYESFSNNPYQVREYGYEYIKGLQGDLKQDGTVLGSAKHYMGDGGTKDGINEGQNHSSRLEMMNKHAQGFYGALSAGVQNIMATYNSWDNSALGDSAGKIHGNHELLTTALKEKMGFEGFVVSDWNGIAQVKGCANDHCPQSINAGVDMVMVPEDWKAFISNTEKDVVEGRIPMSRIDDAVTRILRVKMQMGLWDIKPSQSKFAGKIDTAADQELARRAVRKSVVLLKNNKNILPLAPNKKVLVIGNSADNISNQTGGWSVTWQGTENTNEDFPNATSLLKAIKAQIGEGNVTYSIDGKGVDPKDYSAIIAIVGETPYAETKGDLRFPAPLSYSSRFGDEIANIERLKGKGTPIISVLYSGRTLYTNDLINASDAFVAAFLPGTEAQGISDLLFKGKDGKIKYDFSAKLSFPWPSNACPPATNEPYGNYKPLFNANYGLTYSQKSNLGKLKLDTRETCQK